MQKSVVGPMIIEIRRCSEGIHKLDVEVRTLNRGNLVMCFEEEEYKAFKMRMVEVDFESVFDGEQNLEGGVSPAIKR